VSVDWATSDGTASEGSDYVVGGGTAIIPTGSTSTDITVTILDDAVFEDDETFTVTLSNPQEATLGTPKVAAVAITDDDVLPELSFSAASSVVAEAAGSVDLTVNLSVASTADVTVDYATTDGTAAAGADYTATSGTLTIPAGQLSGTITVPILDDAVFEGDEDFSLTLSNPQGATLGTPATSTITITDDEGLPDVSFSAASSVVAEAAGSVDLTVNLSAASAADVTVDYATTDGTATAGADYTATSGTLTLPAGQLSGTITVPILDDAVFEGDEDFSLTLSNPQGATLGTPAASTITITDDEGLPDLSFSAASSVVAEAAGSVDLTVNLSAASAADVTVDYATTDGTATAGADYTATIGTLTIPAGQLSGTITVPILDDAVFEGDEDFSLALSNAQGATLGTLATSTITITDDDSLPVISFSATGSIVSETAGSVTLDVELSATVTGDVTVDWATADGTATAGADYTAASGSLVIPSGQLSGVIVVNLLDDAVQEGPEDFDVTLTAPIGADLGSPATSTVTINDDEAPAQTVSFSVSPDTLDQLEGSPLVSISSGVATFSGDTVDFVARRGQRLTYGVDSVAFIQGCSDAVTCDVIRADGLLPPDTGPVAGTGLFYEFASIASALSGAATHLGTTDLVAANLVLELECYGDGSADTQAVDVSGWTTGSGRELVIRSAPGERHLGKWTDSAYRLEVSGSAACIRSTVGDVVIDGLQLYCTDDAANDVAGVLFDGSGVTGVAEIADVLIRLDGATGTGARLGFATPAVGDLELRIRNAIVWDLGSGTARHAGILVEDDSVTARIAGVTVDGGSYGIRRTAGTAIVKSSLAVNATVADFAGAFDLESIGNASSDATAPGSAANHGTKAPFVEPSAGTTADLHLECDPLTSATITSVPIDIGNVNNVFDGDPRSLARSANVNPAWVQVEFTEPVSIIGTAVAFSHATGHDWFVAMADTAADMSSQSGSYRVVVPMQEARPAGLPDPNFMWDEAQLAAPESGRVIRLEALKLDDAYVHIGEWELEIAGTPCEAGADLSGDAIAPFATDIDGEVRIVPWDVGADEATFISAAFTRSNMQVWEEEGQAVLEVLLSDPAPAQLAVAFRTVPSSATEGVDYTGTSGELVFAAGEVRSEIVVPINDDELPDDSENFGVELAKPSGGFTGGDWISIMLRDGASPVQVFLDPDSVTVDEGAGNATVQVRLSAVSGGDVSVNWESNDITARMGIDYGAAQGNVTIPAGQISANVTVPIIDDAEAEWAELLSIKLTWSSDAELRSPTMTQVGITDNEDPTISLAGAAMTVDETAGVAQINVVLSSVQDHDVSVDWTAADGTATFGADYTSAAGTVTVPSGQTYASFQIDIIDDAESEADETILLSLANPVGIALGEPSAGTLTILDDDRLPVVSFASAAVVTAENAGAIDLTVVLDQAGDVPVDVQVDTAEGTAVAGADYEAYSGVLTIPTGQISGVVSITVFDDGLPEGDEIFSVTLSSPTGADLGTPATVTVTILADTSLPDVLFAYPAYATDENYGPVVLDVMLDQPPVTEVSVQVTSTDGEAIAGVDFTAVDQIVTFAAGETSKAVVVELYDDAIYEHAETFSVSLSAPSGANLGTPDTSVVTIYQSDWPPFVYLAEGGNYTAAYTAFEALGEIVIPVRLAAPSGVVAEIDYATSGGTATPGADYTEVSGTLVFQPGVTEIPITIPILSDPEADGGETFSLTLTNPVDCTPDGYLPYDGVVTIYDDEWVRMRDLEVSLQEGAGSAVITVERTIRTSMEARVDYATADGTATEGEDYTPTSGTLIFPPSSLSQQIVVPLIDDLDVEDDETFTVTLSNAVNHPLGNPMTTVVTVLDNERPEVYFYSSSVSVGEDSGEVLLRARVSFSVTEDVLVNYTTVEGAATEGADYTSTTGTLTITAGSSYADFSVPILEDWLIEGDEVFSVELSNPLGAVIRNRGVVGVIITDNDQAGVVVSPLTIETGEDGTTATISLVLTAEPSAPVTITVNSSDSTEGIVSPASVEFTAGTWDQPQSVTVTGVDDGAVDGDIPYVIHVWPATSDDPNFAGVDGDDVRVINIDDEVIDKVTVTIEQLAGPVDEDAGLVLVRAWLTGTRPETIWVPYRTEGTADGDDFTISPADVIEFPAGTIEAEFEVTIVDDLEPEATESIRIALESTRQVPIGNPHASDIWILDNEGLPVAAISKPLAGSFYRTASPDEPHTVLLDRSASTVPPGFTAWFAVLIEGSGVPGGPMDVAYLLPADQETGSFDITDSDHDYIIRLVVADTVDDAAFRMTDLPCSSTPTCDSTEVRYRNYNTSVFLDPPYTAPEVVFLRFGPDNRKFERSTDGGETWGPPGTGTSLLDYDVEAGHAYHYRVELSSAASTWLYPGDTTVGPGDPVEVPVWGAPRIMPSLQSVEWDIPEGLTVFDSTATATLHLEGEDGDSLKNSTIRIFVNEPTFDLLAGNGWLIEPEWEEWGFDEGPAKGRDFPWCAIRREFADVTVDVGDADSVDVAVPGLIYGANGFRFEVEHPQRGISERSLLMGIHEFPENYTITLGSHTRVYSRSFLPFFFSNQIREEVPEIWGRGPTYRPSPDCLGGDLTTNNYPKTSLYEADLEFWSVAPENSDYRFNVVTDTGGLWRVTGYTYSWLVDDAEYEVVMGGCDRDTTPSAWGFLGHIGRWILDADGAPLSTDATAQFGCSLRGDWTSVFFSDFDPPLPVDGHPPGLDPADVQPVTVEDVGGGQIAGGFYTAPSLVRFRITDLLHDVILDPGDPDTITVVNNDAGTSQTVYYSADQVLDDPDAGWGWLVAEVPLRIEDAVGETDNQLVFHATDRAGNQLGGGAGITATVTRVREARYLADLFEVDETDDPTTEAVITVKLTAISDFDITVRYSVTEDTASNAATAGVDFEPVIDQPLVIPAGVSEVDFPVTIYGDDDTEPVAETVRLTLDIDPSQPAFLAVPSDAILHIVDDDQVAVSAHVTAEMDEPTPGSVRIDGTGSVVPNLGLTGGGVAVWALTKTSIYYGNRSPMFEYNLSSPAQLLREFLIPSGYDVRVRLVVAANQGVLDSFVQESSDLHEIDPPCTAATSGDSCDTFDLAIENPCRLAKLYSAAGVNILTPPDGYRLPLGDDLSLRCEAHYNGLNYPYIGLDEYDFGYRWSLASAADPTQPLKTFGLPGFQGFDLGNREFSAPWTEIDLPIGAYRLTCEVRYPPHCGTYAFVSGSDTIDVHITHSLDGVAPGRVVEDATFRVYSNSLLDQLGVGGQAIVLIDDDPDPYDDTVLEYSLTIQAGGFLELIADPQYLPAGAYYAFVVEDQAWTGLSAPVSFVVEPPGTEGAPNLVTDEESTSCGDGGVSVNAECAHKVVPGQIWQGEWGEAGDEDFFTFLTGAGTELSITLERVDTSLPPQDPSTPAPEILVARPDGLVFVTSEPLPTDATGASVVATAAMDGRYFVIARTMKGSGAYQIKVDKLSEGGTGAPAFGFTKSTASITTSSYPSASFRDSVFDGFGNPISGVGVQWEEGSDCGDGTFCGGGQLTVTQSSVEGFVSLAPTTQPGAVQLWRPEAALPTDGGASKVTTLGASLRGGQHSPAHDPVFGRIRTNGLAIIETDLPDLETAMAIREQSVLLANLKHTSQLKNGPNCDDALPTCQENEAPVFRAAQLVLNPDEMLVDVELKIFDGGEIIEVLDGEEVVSSVPLTLEATACIQDAVGVTCDIAVDGPVAVLVNDDYGAAIEQGGATCSSLSVTSGAFTYWVGRSAMMNFTHIDDNNDPCCWLPMEWINAVVVVNTMVDDGQGGFIAVSKRTEATVESSPRPASPCEVRPYPPGPYPGGVPEIGAIRDHPLGPGDTSAWQNVGSAYVVDACGNLERPGVNDDQLLVTTTSPSDPQIWTELEHSEGGWWWRMYLHSTHFHTVEGDDLYYIPGGLYTVTLQVDGAPECGGGTVTYGHTVDYAVDRPTIQLVWEQDGTEPKTPVTSPRSALQAPESGEQIAWRVRPADSDTGFNGGTIFTDVPVKLYVAENRVVFDHDGNVLEMMMKVDDAKLCTGEVSVHHDPDAYPDPDWLTVSTTCDQIHVGEALVAAYTEPEWWNNTFDGPIGISVGVAAAPSQNGTYYLIAEPLDEAFRRGESWRIDQDWSHLETGSYAGTYRKDFDVIDSQPSPDLACDTCVDCAVGDIGLRNGNLRYSEADPAPGLPVQVAGRTYDSLNTQDGFFGAGWTSLFDVTATESTATSGYSQPSKAIVNAKSSTIDQVTVRTEDNRWFVFSPVDGGGYFQSWPEGGAPSQLQFDGSDYSLELNGSPYRRIYRGSDGKLIKLTDIASGRDFTIVYNQTTGAPTEVIDSWRGSVASITVADGHITEINTAEGSVTFEYGGDATLDSTSASGSVWRGYAYSGDDLLTEVIDGAGYMIDTFTYADGRPTSSISAGDSITSVEWGATGPRSAMIGEQVVRTDAATGSSTYYYLRRVAGKYRVVEVMGECACSGNDRVYAYDALGNLIMEQDGRGYITRHEYLGDGRRTLDEVGLRPSGCDPADYPEAPETCRVTVDELASFGAADLTPTDVYRAVWFAYDDPSWPNQPTQVCRSSVLQLAGQSDRVSCRSTTYDPNTGQWTSSTETGWSGQSAVEAVFESRTTTRTFYGGAYPNAAFDPGGAFDPAWLTAAQPENLVRSSDGPRSDVADVVQLVYYPVVEVPEAPVPLPLRGRLAAQMDPEGNITHYEDYDVWGRARRIIGPAGIVTELTFDGFGRPLTSTIVGGEGCDPIDDPLCSTDLVTTSTYGPGGGPLESVTSPGGVVTEYSYDSFGRILTTDRGPSVSELLERVENEYDPITGLRVRDSRLAYDAGNGWVEHSRTEYDHYITGQLIRVDRPRFADDPTPAEEHFAYDVAGRIATVQDANHTSPNVEYFYGPLGRLERVSQLLDPGAPADGQYAVTGYAYDAGGNLIAVTDANENLTEFLVDDFGQTVRITSPVTGATEVVYNPAGQLVTRTDSRGVMTTNAYDANGRLTGVTYDDGVTTEELAFEYDVAGRRTRAESPGVVQTFAHSRRGLILTATQDIGGDVHDTAYQYNLDGRLQSVVYPSGRTVDYVLDFIGRPTAISSVPPGGGAPITVAENLEYLPFGPPTHLELGPPGGQLVETRDYDWHYRRTAQDVADATPTTLLDLDYAYDPAGNLTTLTDSLGDRSAGYDYDDLGRLTGVTWADAARIYDYDPIGNLERIGVDEGLPGEGEVVLGYTSNAVGENSPILESTDTYQGGSPLSSYTVATDPAGNITSDGLTGLSYDLKNKLDDRQLNGATLDYAYSADGRLVRSVRSDTGVITDLVLDVAGRRLAKYDDGAWRDYVYLSGQLLAYFDDGEGEPVQVIADHTGMPMMAVGGTGAVVWQAKAEPYGELRGEVGLSADPGLRYPGQWQDELDLEAACTGDTCTIPGPVADSFSLFENGYRWYKPGWGRYTQSDPIGEEPNGSGGPHGHLYLYGRSNPMFFIDPLGLEECCLCPGKEWRLTGTFTGWVVAGWPGGSEGNFETNGAILECLGENNLKLEARAACKVRDAERPSLAFAIELSLDPGIPITACNLDDLKNQDIYLSGAGFDAPFLGRRLGIALSTEGLGHARGFFSVNLNCTIEIGSYPPTFR